MRRLIALTAAVLLAATTQHAARAEEVPPSPLPVIDYGSIVGNAPHTPTSADAIASEARAACHTGYELIFGGGRINACDTAAQENRCFHLDYYANLSTNGTRVIWAPYIDAGCYVKKNTTIPLYISWKVTSSYVGVLVNQSIELSISPTQQLFAFTTGSHECRRDLGATEQITFEGTASAGGISTSAVQGGVIFCN